MSAPAAFRMLSPLRTTVSLAPKLRHCTRSPFPCGAFGATPLALQNSKRLFSQSRSFQEKKYTEQHEWVELANNGQEATIGITDYAAKALGDVIFVELPALESEVSAGENIGAVESVKSASDIMSPVTGTVVGANTALEEKPKTINESPEGDGWIARIKVTDTSTLEGLMDAKAYQASLAEEE